MFRESYRKYCSRICGERARQQRKYPDRPHKLWVHKQTDFEMAMEKHWSGEDSAEIARQLNIPVGTVYSWVHDFGGQKRRVEPLRNRLKLSQNAEEWLTALRESTLTNYETETTIICLVCEKFTGRSVNKLSTIVFEKLKENPLNGKTYAFCNKMQNMITTLLWREPVFCVSQYIKLSGTFVWAHESFGGSVEITKAEFEHLISIKKMNKSSKTLDFMRIS